MFDGNSKGAAPRVTAGLITVTPLDPGRRRLPQIVLEPSEILGMESVRDGTILLLHRWKHTKGQPLVNDRLLVAESEQDILLEACG